MQGVTSRTAQELTWQLCSTENFVSYTECMHDDSTD